MTMSQIAAVRWDLLSLIALIVTTVPCWAQEPQFENPPTAEDVTLVARRESVEAPDIYARLIFLSNELDQIRFEMGKPELTPMKLEIVDVAPREVYFQVETLFKKANQLNFEQTREDSKPAPRPDRAITPADVMVVVEASLVLISRVRTHLEITEPSILVPVDRSKTPTDVFIATATINRQLNLLLDRPFSPAQAYEQLTLAIGYTARLRAQFPGDRIPATPQFVRGKRSRDIYQKLTDCFAIIQQIAARSELPMLDLDTRGDHELEVNASDVYDMATLVVSELSYLWSQLEDAPPPRPAYYPGRKLPSHVYQRAGLLERQLAELSALVDSYPRWLAQ
jgi:hypothetical protein